MLPALYTLPIYDFDLRATHARTLLPAALASVSFEFVLVRVPWHVEAGKWKVEEGREARSRKRGRKDKRKPIGTQLETK